MFHAKWLAFFLMMWTNQIVEHDIDFERNFTKILSGDTALYDYRFSHTTKIKNLKNIQERFARYAVFKFLI